MSSRHLFPNISGLVNKGLRGLVTYNTDLAFDSKNRIIYDTAYDKSKVGIISGGGSGHEPGWAGYVGENMMTGCAQGDIFASPSTKQIVAAINSVPSDEGCILVITNYTGDCLHFGLATEKANAQGHKVKMIICGDDVSRGKSDSMVGRRGLAGQIGTLKIMGGASGAGGSLDQVYDLGVAFSQAIVSIAATVDHCHVPGRSIKDTGFLAPDTIELGTGPHNEPGQFKLSPQPTPAQLVKQMLEYCLKQDDPIRSYVKFEPNDEVMLLVSNFGGMSNLEMGALVDELLEQLEADYKMVPSRIANGMLETSLNAPAFSVSVVNVTQAAKNCSYSAEQIMGFFDTRTNTAWEGWAGAQSKRRTRQQQYVDAPPEPARTIDPAKDIQIDPSLLKKMVTSACEALIANEPDLTKWDSIMGDGDCGETLRSGGQYLLDAIAAGCTDQGSVTSVLHEVEDIVEGKLGGTLGGILGIYFVAMRNAVEKHAGSIDTVGLEKTWAEIVTDAYQALRQYTPAKEGDRTVMDTLITFADKYKAGGTFAAGVEGADEGAQRTKNLKPRLGRATYVGDGENVSKGIPDPGAMGAKFVIDGLFEASK